MSKYRVTPTHLKHGAKAPSFIIEEANKHEAIQASQKEFELRSNLSRYKEWTLDIQKI